MPPRYSTISAATIACRQAFEQCLPIPCLMENEWAENRLADFNLWSEGAGASAKQRASLDHRLESEPEMKGVIINLLRMLIALLEKCRKTAQDMAQKCPLEPSSVTGALLDDSDEASLVMHAKPPSTVSDLTRNDITSAERTILRQNMGDFEAILKALIRLTRAIRKTGTTSRLHKADDRFDPAAHEELTEHLKFILASRPSEHANQSCEQVRYFQPNEIQMRLIEANLRRRNRFLYQQKHSRKLAVGANRRLEDVKQNAKRVWRRLKRRVRGWYKYLFARRKGPSSHRTTQSRPREASQPTTEALSDTSASEIRGPVKAGNSSPSTVVSSTSIRADYPKPPKSTFRQQSFKCPCCCQSLEIGIAGRNRWRKHLAEDIQPYTCILENCPKPSNLFETRKAWMRHMKTEHKILKYWRCPDTSCEQREFKIEKDFISHLATTQHESISKSDIPLLVSACARSSPTEIQSCPLCPQGSFLTNVSTTYLLSHVADHVQSFSLRSLPWMPDKKNAAWVQRFLRSDSDNYFYQNPYFDIGSENGSSAQGRDALSDRSWEGLEPLEFEDEQPDLELVTVDPEVLRVKLQEARIEYPRESHQFFVPESNKVSIITEEVIASEISTARPDLGCNVAREQAKMVCNKARNLFAILAYLGKGREICAFLEEGISDKDLPFERSRHQDKRSEYALQRKDGRDIKALDQWGAFEVESLGRGQWYMLSPVFKGKMRHYKLHRNTVLPFIPLDDEERYVGGEYSSVFATCIHPAHHEFHDYWVPADTNHQIAIKRPFHNDENKFEKERSIHRVLGQKQDASPHLVKLLATYEYHDQYHFIFPRADCNLRQYWAKNPTPTFTKKTLFWSLKQMAGIASGLNTIHNFRVTVPLDGKCRTPTGEVEHPVKEGEELYGRHGDIHAQNILWFQRMSQHQGQTQYDDDDDQGGILQITGFSMSRFSGRDAEVEEQPNGIYGSPTYETPEVWLRLPVSRAYDLWGLGCVYLEFVTWLVMGNNAIEDFSEHRACTSSIFPQASDDFFFKVMRDEYGVVHATLRDGVIDWAQKLHEHPKCSEFIHDVVDLVMKELLVIQAEERISASWLCMRLDSHLKKAEVDESYLCEPVPRLKQ